MRPRLDSGWALTGRRVPLFAVRATSRSRRPGGDRTRPHGRIWDTSAPAPIKNPRSDTAVPRNSASRFKSDRAASRKPIAVTASAIPSGEGTATERIPARSARIALPSVEGGRLGRCRRGCRFEAFGIHFCSFTLPRRRHSLHVCRATLLKCGRAEIETRILGDCDAVILGH